MKLQRISVKKTTKRDQKQKATKTDNILSRSINTIIE